jgi:uroporphyrinogen-III synthase
LSSALRELGLPVLLWPAVTVTELVSDDLKEALQEVQAFDWIVFASRHAVAAVTRELGAPPAGVHIAAVGPATAQALQERGWPVDLLPPEASAAALVSAFATVPQRADRILYPASSRALPTILAGLSQLGAQVVQVEAYRTDSAALDAESCRGWIARGEIGAVTFASPSAVLFLERALGKADFDRLLSSAPAVTIGATTAAALAERGHAAVMAETATFQGLALTTLRTLQSRH